SSFAGKFDFKTPVNGSPTEMSRTVGMRYVPGYQVGARVHQNLNPYWGVGLEYSFSDQEVRFTNLSPDIPTLPLGHYIHNLSYNVSYLPRTPQKAFRPYVDAGTGFSLFYFPARSSKKARDFGLNLRDSWQMVLNLGGGFKYLIMDQFSIE